MTEWAVAAVGAVLGVLAVIDVKTKQIPVTGIGVLFLASVLAHAGTGFQLTGILLGVLPGGIALLLSHVTGGKLGNGDGLVLLAVGLGFGLNKTIFIWGIALCLASVMAMVLLILKKAERKSELPFVPCIFWGYVICQCSDIIM